MTVPELRSEVLHGSFSGERGEEMAMHEFH